jgi:ABC-2 type transport system permease protein
MKKYIKIFKNRISAALEYRSNIVGTFLNRLIGIAGYLIFWSAVFKTNESVGGYNFAQMLMYYMTIPIVARLTSSKIAEKVPSEIREGNFSNQLLKPVRIWSLFLFDNMARTVIQSLVFISTYLIIFIVITTTVGNDIFTTQGILLGLLMCFLGYVLHTMIDFTVTWTTFWFQSIWSFRHLKYILFAILGGLSFPFEIVPKDIRNILQLLPFKFMYYTPTSYFLGTSGSESIVKDIIVGVVWIIVFFLLANILWKKGLRKYEAYGN